MLQREGPQVTAEMEFRLLFEGQVKPRQRADLFDIHEIRKQLHPQIKKLWEHPPLDECRKMLRLPTSNGDYAVYEERGSKIYAPLVTKRTDLLGELDITLRQQAKGQLISEGGDIDNRLKTLFDALRVPSEPVRFLRCYFPVCENRRGGREAGTHDQLPRLLGRAQQGRRLPPDISHATRGPPRDRAAPRGPG
jgi:hypothetical protein